MPKNLCSDMLLGIAIGDALGVPYEFKDRFHLKSNPAEDMVGFGTHNQEPGTFSDDSSLAFCLAEVLIEGYNLNAIAQNFVKWKNENYWTARGEVFDIGNATFEAINKLTNGIDPKQSGNKGINSNGNGSLMRILPLVLYIKDLNIEERFKVTNEVSSITHAHIRSIIACFYYLEFALGLLKGENKMSVYNRLQNEITDFLCAHQIENQEIKLFERLLKHNIYDVEEEKIFSSGYVVHTLEAAIWCLMTTESYPECVLKAVNLGDDTDTTAAVAGGLSALVYSLEGVPDKWLSLLSRREDIKIVGNELYKKYYPKF